MSEKDEKTITGFVYSYIKDGYELETRRMEALDSKSNLLTSLSSFLTGVLLVLISLAYKDLSVIFAKADTLSLLVGILLVLTSLFFLVATSYSIWASSVRKYWEALVYQAEDIDRWVQQENQVELEIFLSKQLQEYWLHNRIENDTKVKWLRKSTLFLSLGSVMLSLCTLLVLGYLLVWVSL